MADDPFEPKPRPLIHINGLPGVGKHTVARALVALFHSHNLSARLVDSQLLIDPADAVLKRTQHGYEALRRALRFGLFETLAENAATHDNMYVFTDSQGTDIVGASTCAEYIVAARQRRCDLVSVVLSCDEETNLERLASKHRATRSAGNVVDAALLRRLKDKTPIHRFSEMAAEGGTLEIDSTHLSPELAALVIFRHVLDACPEVESDMSDCPQTQ
ncbi:hypothetical protein PG996_011413 [Apiospora saccharicola]|uniref:ATP-binding protein n=1 Tax=Apiospora saccharicola TaxID=335842 RepID=A0ABR1UF13_9PEZI